MIGHKVKIIKTDKNTAEIYIDDERFSHVTEYSTFKSVNEIEKVSLTFFASSVEIEDRSDKETTE